MPILSSLMVRSSAPAAHSSTLSIAAAELSAILCQTLPYGIYLATCFPCCRTVFFVGSGREERWRHLNEVHWMMATIGLALFAILTFDLTISWLEIFQAFVNSDDAVAVFMEIRSWIKLAQVNFFFVLTPFLLKPCSLVPTICDQHRE